MTFYSASMLNSVNSLLLTCSLAFSWPPDCITSLLVGLGILIRLCIQFTSKGVC